MNVPKFLYSALTGAILVAMAPATMAQTYTFTDLGSGTARAVNDAGDIVGNTASGVATLWDGSSEIALSGAGAWNVASDIDASGQISGFYDPTHTQPGFDAVAWNSGAAGPRSALPSGLAQYSIALSINDSGATAGYVYNGAVNFQEQAVVWSNGSATVLGSVLGAPFSHANAINNNGQEAGYVYSNFLSGYRQAVVWNGTTPTILNGISSIASTDATALNNHGEVAGYVHTPGLQQAVVWNGSTPTILASLGGKDSAAYGINNAGAVVGFSYLAGNSLSQATLWQNGKIIDLNSYLTPTEVQQGWVLEAANAINDSGTIVGEAENTLTGKQYAFALNITAVPEPQTIVMWLAGLSLVMVLTNRRRKAARVRGR